MYIEEVVEGKDDPDFEWDDDNVRHLAKQRIKTIR
jgi:hypothetical protein